MNKKFTVHVQVILKNRRQAST